MDTSENVDEPESHPLEEPEEDRRDFLQKAACVALGGVVTLVPAGSAITVLVSPLFDKSVGGLKVRLTSIDSLEVGGPPKLFKVVTERQDAWTKHHTSEIGSVYVQRTGQGNTPSDFQAFNSTCPHLGCAVEFLDGAEGYSCPCHDSTFATTGEVLNQSSPSPRGLDSLEVEIEDDQLWVIYLKFKPNVTDKIPVA